MQRVIIIIVVGADRPLHSTCLIWIDRNPASSQVWTWDRLWILVEVVKASSDKLALSVAAGV